MKKDFFEAANLLHTTLRAATNCYVDGKIIAATQIVAIDDDATSAMWAAKLFYEIRQEYGYCPTILCVGGKGLMSKHTHQKSEAELLSSVLQDLGISKSRIVCLGEGKNSGDNVLAVAECSAADAVTIWCATQRLSLRLERTQAQQAPQLKSYYFVIEQNLDEVMRAFNGKGLCGRQMLLHELASILNRCEAYAGTFQKPLEMEVSDDVRNAAKLLERNFRLKLPGKNLRSLLQFIQLFFAILKNKKNMKRDLKENVLAFAKKLRDEKLVGPGDALLGSWIPTKIIGFTPERWNGCHGWTAEYEGGDPIYAEAEYPYNLH